MLTLTDITIPTPAPYDADEPLKQLENLCYVVLQVLQKFQAAETDVDAVTAIKDLQYSGLVAKFGNVEFWLHSKAGGLRTR